MRRPPAAISLKRRNLERAEISKEVCLNYSYVPEPDFGLQEFLARNPAAGLHEIRRSHPKLRAMSLDQLSLRIAQLERRLTSFASK